MLNRGWKRSGALLLCALLLLNLAPRGLAAAENPDVVLSSPEDLVRFGKDCALDSWSRRRTVWLAADLDLTGQDFVPIPTFGGTFEGQGHTISGISLTGSGSSVGFFRFLQPGAVVRDLTVSGVICPSGSASQVGGVAGTNSGSIQNCAFKGSVKGECDVGGLVGLNRETGEVSGCSVSGQIVGASATGGVAGQNLGVLLKCGSSAEVNTHSPDVTTSLQDLAASSAGQLAGGPEDQELDDMLASHSDTGGIVGLSSGVVQSCTNTGEVGYPHVGYNIGGVAGRQNGYLAGCTNNGTVNGRKDVGGIVGQAEPDVVIRPGSDTLDTLRQELNTLDGLIERALDNTDAQSSRISRRLTAMGGYTGQAREHSRTLLDRMSDFVDGNVAEINSLSASVTAALDRVSPALDDLSGAAGLTGQLRDSLDDALDSLSQAGDIGQDAAIKASGALDRLNRAGRQLEQAVQALREALDRLQDAVIHKDPEGEKEAMKDLSAGLTSLSEAFAQASTAASAVLEALRAGGLPLPDEEVQALTAALSAMGSAAQKVGDSLNTLSESLELDWDTLRGTLDRLSGSFGSLSDAAGSFSSAMAALGRAVDRIKDLDRPMKDAAESLRGAGDAASHMGDLLERAFEAMGRAVDILRENGPATLLPLGEEFRAAGDGLYAAVSGLSDEMEALHSDTDSARSTLTRDLRAVSRQLSAVSSLMLDAMTDLREGVQDPEIVVDSSDLDFQGVRPGKIAQCVNLGETAGDRNVGGIAGAMSIEYDLDPEEDTERFSLGSTYETRAVLLENVNRGTVTAKKDCVGGVTGRMDLGAAVDCENYGGVESTGGSYVGGVAGWSDAVIRSSFSKCTLSGQEDVGGIAGWAARLYDCRAIAVVSGGDERVGAIAGSADLEGGQIAGNRFVNTGWAGIDGVSYEGMAQPVSYAELREEPGVPQSFLAFTLTLRAGEDVVASIPLEYGQSLSGLALPQVPEREGCYGRWPDFDGGTVCSDITLEAVYAPWAALVASEEKTDGGLALALAEGRFTEDTRLHVRSGAQAAPWEGQGGEVWEISLTGAQLPDSGQVPIRLLDPSRNGRVLCLQNGQWREVKSIRNGQYLMLDMEGLSAAFCVVPGRNGMIPLLAGTAAALLAAAVLAARGVKRKKPRKGRTKTAV